MSPVSDCWEVESTWSLQIGWSLALPPNSCVTSGICWRTWFQEWRNIGVEQLRLSTVDMTGVPTLANLQKGVQFALKYQEQGQSVYVHCKAGRSRSATMVAAYLIQVYNWSPEEAVRAITKIRSHIHIRSGQLEVLKEFHKEIKLCRTQDFLKYFRIKFQY